MATLRSRKYRSATKYLFREEQADAIVRTTAYHRKDFPLSVISFFPREHVPIRSSIATPFQQPTSNTTVLGSLDRLPLELWHDVLLRLDMHSLFRFRQTSIRSREIVDSLHEYRMVTSHGLNLLCALLRTRVATHVSLSDFYHALCTKDCPLCGEFGGFISLLTWQRCCFNCLRRAPETQVQTLAAVRRQFHLTRAESRQLRSFRTLPGTYSMEETSYKSRISIVSARQAMLAFGQRPHDIAPARPASWRRNERFKFAGSCALPYYDKRTGKVEHGVSCAGCQLARERKIIGSTSSEWGFEARDKVYAQDGFLNHFRWCEQAQVLWKLSGEGNQRPMEMPFAAWTGGFFTSRYQA
ncbi:hypothetical protein GGS23DRAFT_481440 [Durotheca rogersii]|uniref:uncharacterized protein n=1 Tax=Durotheca rogersii TaxID=419775 RepID=UPI0022205F9B|nr:uncharacterized protein GGS23DRAFT_481440 [Durotheca rogersii]KAI5864080.1 hypothetical protein GGS23DRAFT_481440 [Durotheca rogersii]